MRYKHLRAGVALAGALTAVSAGPAVAATPTDTKPLQDAVKVGNDTSGIRQHLKKLQHIANANNGTRATATRGHEQSADYVISKLPTDYSTVPGHPFVASVWNETAPPTLSATPAPPSPWVANTDFATMGDSPSGSVSGPIA